MGYYRNLTRVVRIGNVSIHSELRFGFYPFTRIYFNYNWRVIIGILIVGYRSYGKWDSITVENHTGLSI